MHWMTLKLKQIHHNAAVDLSINASHNVHLSLEHHIGKFIFPFFIIKFVIDLYYVNKRL